MLFSNEHVARVIHERFEPVWQSVRPVPLVTIDFGNGLVVQRTLHGNVATYACTADGQVLDIIPGVYDPGTYEERLIELARLHDYVLAPGDDSSDARLRAYHQQQADALAENREPDRLAEVEYIKHSTIFGAEYGTKVVLVPAARMAARAAAANRNKDNGFRPTEGVLARFPNLMNDTRLNEGYRRLQIHRYLARRAVKPDDVTKWLYREVLHADLDDPYVGLSGVLFENYPFDN